MTDEYSHEQLDSAISKTAEWCEAFSNRAEFAALSEAQQRKTGAITKFFTQYSYTYIGATPEEWDPGVVRECCTVGPLHQFTFTIFRDSESNQTSPLPRSSQRISRSAIGSRRSIS